MNKSDDLVLEERTATAIAVIRGHLHDHPSKNDKDKRLRLRSEEALNWARDTGQRLGYERFKYFVDVPLPVLEEMVRMADLKVQQKEKIAT